MKLAPLFLLAPCVAFAQNRQPNIVLFLVDDMGLMDTSVPFLVDTTGNPRKYPLNDWYHTPNMERLAERGVRFSRFYAQSVSSPSRASILTGQNSARHRTTNWINPRQNNRTEFGPCDWNWTGLTSESVTLPRILKASGYKTIHVGKAHFGPFGSEGENPLNIGFDVNIAGSSIGHPGSYYGQNGYGHIAGHKANAVPGLEKYHGTDMFLTDALTLEAKEQIDIAVVEGRPFFLHMSHYAVHSPFEPDPRFTDRYEARGKSPKAVAFASLIEGMDRSLGELMHHFDDLGIADETLIIFLGDNGSDAPLGDKYDHASSAPLRGKKGTSYEGGVRVPFIVAWAGEGCSEVRARMPVAMGEIELQEASVMDIFPTVLSLAGAAIPEGHLIDGSDISQLIAGDCDRKRSCRVLMHFPHAHNSSYFTTYRTGGWKLIYYNNPGNPNNPEYELFNLETDPYEDHNLAGEEFSQLKKMVRSMQKEMERQGALLPVDGNGCVVKVRVP